MKEMKEMKVILKLTLALVMCLIPSFIDAHTVEHLGQLISWYPPACCSDADCRVIDCDSIVALKQGMYGYLDMIWRPDQVKESLDQFCHACYNNVSRAPYCLFVQSGV